MLLKRNSSPVIMFQIFSKDRAVDSFENHLLKLCVPTFSHDRAITLWADFKASSKKICRLFLMLKASGYKRKRKSLTPGYTHFLTSSQNLWIRSHRQRRWKSVPFSSPHLMSEIALLYLLSFLGWCMSSSTSYTAVIWDVCW